jgi:hypothetical protein
MTKLSNKEEETLLRLYKSGEQSASAAELCDGTDSLRQTIIIYLNNLVKKGYAEKIFIERKLILYKPLITYDEYKKMKIDELCSGVFRSRDELYNFLISIGREENGDGD